MADPALPGFAVLIGEVVALTCHVFPMVEVPPAVRSFCTNTNGASVRDRRFCSFWLAIEMAGSYSR
jgi:hypothetical protein